MNELRERFWDIWRTEPGVRPLRTKTWQDEQGRPRKKVFTAGEPWTEADQDAHLDGRKCIGLSPLFREGDGYGCVWAPLDVDTPKDPDTGDHRALTPNAWRFVLERVAACPWPFTVFRSSCGSANLMATLPEPVTPEQMHAFLKQCADNLSLIDHPEIEGVEVYPKSFDLDGGMGQGARVHIPADGADSKNGARWRPLVTWDGERIGAVKQLEPLVYALEGAREAWREYLPAIRASKLSSVLGSDLPWWEDPDKKGPSDFDIADDEQPIPQGFRYAFLTSAVPWYMLKHPQTPGENVKAWKDRTKAAVLEILRARYSGEWVPSKRPDGKGGDDGDYGAKIGQRFDQVREEVEEKLAQRADEETNGEALHESEMERAVRDAGFEPVTAAVLTELRELQQQPAEAIPTGLRSLDRRCRGQGGGKGFGRGWWVMLTGLTGAGKTITALNFTASALRAGYSAVFFSLEMDWKQLLTRLGPVVEGCDISHVEWGDWHRPDVARRADAALLNLPGTLYVNRAPIWELRDVRLLMEYHARLGCRLCVLDYAQLVSGGTDARLMDAMSRISSELRFQAQRLGMTTLAISQLNRATTNERDRPPTIEGLFGSSRFGFDADLVLALDYSQRDRDAKARTERTRLLVLKNRHGPEAHGEHGIPIELDFRTFRVRDLTPEVSTQTLLESEGAA